MFELELRYTFIWPAFEEPARLGYYWCYYNMVLGRMQRA